MEGRVLLEILRRDGPLTSGDVSNLLIADDGVAIMEKSLNGTVVILVRSLMSIIIIEMGPIPSVEAGRTMSIGRLKGTFKSDFASGDLVSSFPFALFKSR